MQYNYKVLFIGTYFKLFDKNVNVYNPLNKMHFPTYLKPEM